MIEELITALKDEFTGDVNFYPKVPSKGIMPPAVAVLPGDPFIVVGTHGAMQERWNITVYANLANSAMAVNQLRDLSLRVLGVVNSLGAVWVQADAIAQIEDSSVIVSSNQIYFRYPYPN